LCKESLLLLIYLIKAEKQFTINNVINDKYSAKKSIGRINENINAKPITMKIIFDDSPL
jgi:hypothetical protein